MFSTVQQNDIANVVVAAVNSTATTTNNNTVASAVLSVINDNQNEINLTNPNLARSYSQVVKSEPLSSGGGGSPSMMINKQQQDLLENCKSPTTIINGVCNSNSLSSSSPIYQTDCSVSGEPNISTSSASSSSLSLSASRLTMKETQSTVGSLLPFDNIIQHHNETTISEQQQVNHTVHSGYSGTPSTTVSSFHFNSSPINHRQQHLSSSTLHLPQSHYMTMYSGGNSFFGANSAAAPSTLVMTPPSPYESIPSSIVSSDSVTSLMQHSASWYHHPTIRSQHHSAYSDVLNSGEWSNSITGTGNSFGVTTTNSALSPFHQMPLQGAYPPQISSVYHPTHSYHHPQNGGRSAETAATSSFDFYNDNSSLQRLSSYPYYSNFNSASSATGHSLTPLSVGIEASSITFNGSTLNASPDSGLTASSEGNESPNLLNHNSENNMMMVIGLNSYHQTHRSSLISESDIKVEIKNESSAVAIPTNDCLALSQSVSNQTLANNPQQQEATSTTVISSQQVNNTNNPTNLRRNSDSKSNHKEPNWINKSSQSSTGKTRTKDKYRVVYSDHQRLELEKEFCSNRYITIKRKSELASQLSLSERQVKIWFQNRRAKDRKQNRKKTESGGKHKDKEKNNEILNVNNSDVVGINVGSSSLRMSSLSSSSDSCNYNTVIGGQDISRPATVTTPTTNNTGRIIHHHHDNNSNNNSNDGNNRMSPGLTGHLANTHHNNNNNNLHHHHHLHHPAFGSQHQMSPHNSNNNNPILTHQQHSLQQQQSQNHQILQSSLQHHPQSSASSASSSSSSSTSHHFLHSSHHATPNGLNSFTFPNHHHHHHHLGQWNRNYHTPVID